MHGLLRTRGFTQDDAHIFCTPEQLAGRARPPARLRAAAAARLRLRRLRGRAVDPARRQSVGDDRRTGTRPTEALRPRLEQAGIPYVVAEGGGAFYGPKIDVHVRDAIGRHWQLSTLQVDFHLPAALRPGVRRRRQPAPPAAVIHRALFGSVERFFGVLLEHYAGALPDLAGAGPGAGAAASGPTTRPTPPSWSSGCGPRASGPTRSTPTSPSAPASARPSSRSCPTSWWSATTTWPPAPSASTRGAARSSGACRSTTSSSGCTTEIVDPRLMADDDTRRGARADGAAVGRLAVGLRRRRPADGALAGERSLFERILALGLPDEETYVVWRGQRCSPCSTPTPTRAATCW